MSLLSVGDYTVFALAGTYEGFLADGKGSLGIGFGLQSAGGVSSYVLSPSYYYWLNTDASFSTYVVGGLLIFDGSVFLNVGGGGIQWFSGNAGLRPEAGILFSTDGGSIALYSNLSITVRI
jgi:hypothetical protein